jgi:hypothetical protein
LRSRAQPACAIIVPSSGSAAFARRIHSRRLRRAGIAAAQLAQQRGGQPLAQGKRGRARPRLSAVGEAGAAVQEQRGIEGSARLGTAAAGCLAARQVIAERLHVGPDDLAIERARWS